MPGVTLAAAQSIASPGDLVRSVRDHTRLALAAADRGARIVVFPELSLTGYHRRLTPRDALTPVDSRLQPLRAVSDSHGLIIVAGAPVASPRGLHIGALSFIPGHPAQTYLKQYLHEGEEKAFVPGDGGEALCLSNYAVRIAVCADIAHPEHAHAAADSGARIYIASCFITPGAYATDSRLLQGYARKHRMVVLMANYGGATSDWQSAGQSAIWSSDGTLLASGPAEGEAIVHASIEEAALV